MHRHRIRTYVWEGNDGNEQSAMSVTTMILYFNLQTTLKVLRMSTTTTAIIRHRRCRRLLIFRSTNHNERLDESSMEMTQHNSL